MVDNVYENLEDYNRTKKEINENLKPIVAKLFIRGRNFNTSVVSKTKRNALFFHENT